ncbi:ankyrin repeat-containing domain protein [Xylaria curta]|nr:ankyrin repeat-containing domain protein [Xylaria curta]
MPVWLYIDALDECRNEMGDPDDETEEVRGLIRDLTKLQQVLGSSAHHLRICCSCGHYPNIASKDEELKILTEVENAADIKAFVERELQEGIAEAEADITGRLQNVIAQNALGSFQWTKLVTSKALSMHRIGKSTTQIIRQIQIAPRQLSTLYHNILKSVPPEDRARSLQLFQWACFSKEPLNTAKLRVLMNVQLEPEAQSYSSLEEHPDFIEGEFQMERLVQSLSGGLAILQDSYMDLKDYLLDKGLAFLDGSKRSRESLTLDTHLCMAYTYAMLYTMTDVTMGLKQVESNYDANALVDFMRLAAQNDELLYAFVDFLLEPCVCDAVALWVEANEECDNSLKSTGIWELESHSIYHTREAINVSSHDVDIQEKLLNSLRPRLITILSRILLSRTLDFAVEYDLPKVCSSILEWIDDIDGWHHWTALTDAAYHGSTEAIEELLGRQVAAGFDPNQTEQIYEREIPFNILGIAASRGNKDMCSLLLRYGASVNLPDAEGWTPLMHAARHGAGAVCELLASRHAPLATFDRSPISPPRENLSVEYERRPPAIKTILKGKNTPKMGPLGPPPPPPPINFGPTRLKQAVATLLGRKGAVLDHLSIRDLSPLNWAVGAGWQPDYEIVKAILSHPHQLERALDEAGRTSLDWALDYYAYIKAELGQRYPTVMEDVIWLEPPYHPQFNMEPPFKLTPSKAARAYEESRLVVRTLREIGVLCRECAHETGLQVAHVSAAFFRRNLETVERAPQQLER